jgi:hypothetical protein
MPGDLQCVKSVISVISLRTCPQLIPEERQRGARSSGDGFAGVRGTDGTTTEHLAVEQQHLLSLAAEFGGYSVRHPNAPVLLCRQLCLGWGSFRTIRTIRTTRNRKKGCHVCRRAAGIRKGELPDVLSDTLSGCPQIPPNFHCHRSLPNTAGDLPRLSQKLTIRESSWFSTK